MVRQTKWPVQKSTSKAPWTEERVNIPVDAEPGELAVGARVRHAQFGEGRVTRMMGGGEHLQLEVIFQERFKKKLLAKYARLEVLL
jgi:DNA helicase-2/ATP-dependent DNA helicase PcrA